MAELDFGALYKGLSAQGMLRACPGDLQETKPLEDLEDLDVEALHQEMRDSSPTDKLLHKESAEEFDIRHRFDLCATIYPIVHSQAHHNLPTSCKQAITHASGLLYSYSSSYAPKVDDDA